MDTSIFSASFIITASLLLIETVFCFFALARKRNNKETSAPDCGEEYIPEIISGFSGLLSTPLALIDGHCQMLSEEDRHKENNADIRRILQNIALAKTLVSSIQKLCGKSYCTEITDASSIASVMLESCRKTAGMNPERIEADIQPGLIWILDRNTLEIAFHILVHTLLENTGEDDKISIRLSEQDGTLVLSGTADGYCGQDSSGWKSLKKIIDRNNGTVTFRSAAEGSFGCEIRFAGTAQEVRQETETEVQVSAATPEKAPVKPFDNKKKTILIQNGCNEMLNLISDSLSETYNIMKTPGPEDSEKNVEMAMPDLVICGTDGNDGKQLLNYIKDRKITMHIPVVMVETGQVSRMDENSLDKADCCISMPVDLKKLKIILKQLLNRIEVLKDYYTSPISNYSIANGKVLHIEDKRFLDRIHELIAENVSDTNLSPEFIAESMSMSLRNLYRKFGSISSDKLASVIKDYRLNYAASLLATSKYTVDEIIFKAGFVNRGTFFKLFRQKYDMTPKQYMTLHQSPACENAAREMTDCA